MRRIAVMALQPKMRLGRRLVSGCGEVLVDADQPLTAAQIEQLRSLGVAFVYVHDKRTDDLNPPELIREEVRLQIIQGLRAIFQRTAERAPEAPRLLVSRDVDQPIQTVLLGTISAREADALVQTLLDELNRTKDVPSVSPPGGRTLADYEYDHAISSAELAVRMGMVLGKPERALHDLCVGALLQNVGKFLLPGLDLTRPGTLSEDMHRLLRTHPRVGFELLKRSVFDPTTSAIVLQHHERLDGSGYPEKRHGKDIYGLAQIVGLADMYHALISNRPHRGPYLPHLALELLMSRAGAWFSVDLIKALLHIVPPYDLGTTVQLSSGAIGVVVDPRLGMVARPIVRLFKDKRGAELPSLPEVDLAAVEHFHEVIAAVVDE